jgi:hypothetical protein
VCKACGKRGHWSKDYRLHCHIISIGQLDERGFKVLIEGGVMRIFDTSCLLLDR